MGTNGNTARRVWWSTSHLCTPWPWRSFSSPPKYATSKKFVEPHDLPLFKIQTKKGKHDDVNLNLNSTMMILDKKIQKHKFNKCPSSVCTKMKFSTICF